MAAPSIEITHRDLQVLGFSLAGEETYFVLPQFSIGFDVGRAPRDVLSADHIFLSHGHTDHSAGIAYYFSQRMFLDHEPGNLYVPAGLEVPVRKLLDLWGEIDGNVPPGNVHVARPDEDVALRRDLLVRPFAVNHPTRSRSGLRRQALGYSVIEVRKKLKPEFQDLMGPEIVALKKKGVEIETRIEVPLIAYCGDTTPGEFFSLPHVRDARLLLLECTFVEPDHRQRARAGGHMHVQDMPEALEQLKNERVILTHLTRRTQLPEAKRLLRRAISKTDLERVAFLAEFKRRRASKTAPSEEQSSSAS